MQRLMMAILAGGWLAAADLPPRGTLHTLDGRGYEGRLELTEGDIITIHPLGAEPVTIPLGELKSAAFQPPPADVAPNRQNDETPLKNDVKEQPTSLLLADGSEIFGDIRSIDAKGVTLVRGGEGKLLKPGIIARIVFTRPLPEGADANARGHSGAILEGGDFFEGDLRSYSDGRATISSVLFGNRTFTAGKDLLAIVFSDAKPGGAKFLLKAADGSLIRAKILHLSKNGATAEDGVGDQWQFDADEVRDIRAAAKE